MNEQEFPKVKGVIKKWTKSGQRYLLHGRDLSGKDIYITIPIKESDTEKDYFKKIEEAKIKLNEKKLGSSIASLLNEYFNSKMFAENTRKNLSFLSSFCLNDKLNKKLVKEIMENDTKPQSKRLRLGQIQRFFYWLKDVKNINVNDPTLGITIKCPVAKRTRCITDDELKVLFSMFSENPEFRLIVRLAFFTGARISSIYELTPNSLRNNHIYYYNKKCKKNYEYPIPLNDPETLSLYRMVARKGYMWSRNLQRIKDHIDLAMRERFGRDVSGETLSIHSLRHSFATRAIQKNVPPEIVSKMLDHASISTTLSVYAKHSQGQIDEAIGKIFE